MELRDGLDDPRATDARDLRARKLGLVRPRVAPDHANARLERLGIDADALDRARSGALATRDLCTLECRPGRARGGEESVAVAENDLRVGPDVHDEVHLAPEMRA